MNKWILKSIHHGSRPSLWCMESCSWECLYSSLKTSRPFSHTFHYSTPPPSPMHVHQNFKATSLSTCPLFQKTHRFGKKVKLLCCHFFSSGLCHPTPLFSVWLYIQQFQKISRFLFEWGLGKQQPFSEFSRTSLKHYSLSRDDSV